MANKNLTQYEPGDLIASRYKVLARIGEGGMASVWKSQDTKTGAEVAVKVAKVPADNESRKKTVSRFNNELKSFAALTSARNVVKLYDMLEEADALIIVMECVEGGTMNHRFREFYDMTVDEIVFYFTRLCSALENSSSHNIVHRDIKLDNVLIGDDGEVKLGDYGIAITSKSDLEAKTIIGTPKYMSPEVCDGQLCTHLSDIYSLGILMYECATGVAPFIFKHPTAKIQNGYLIEMQKYARPIEPRKINKKIPQSLENLILRMIEKNPEYRPQTAGEVRKELISIQENKEEGIKPYIYRSKVFNSQRNNAKQNKVGIVYDKLSSRFKYRFTIAFLVLTLVLLAAIAVVLVV